MRKQYNFWPGEKGLDAWDIDRLVVLSRNLPVVEIALDSIDEVDTNYWFDYGPITPTVRRVVEHMRLTQEVDMSYPIGAGVSTATGQVNSHESPGLAEPRLLQEVRSEQRSTPELPTRRLSGKR